jgi:hypothetical protein
MSILRAIIASQCHSINLDFQSTGLALNLAVPGSSEWPKSLSADSPSRDVEYFTGNVRSFVGSEKCYGCRHLVIRAAPRQV